MLFFNDRINLCKIYDLWINENGARECALSLIGFLTAYDLLNEDNVRVLIKQEKEDGRLIDMRELKPLIDKVSDQIKGAK